jgi:hypothetical protein
VTANNFRGQDIAERIRGVREGEEDQDGGGCFSKFHSKAKIFKKKTSIPEAAVFSLGADACGSSCLFPSLLVCPQALYMPCPTL